MTSPARRERSALCDTFETVGPDAPTLCSPWRTRDLAAHLVIREGRPDAALGMLVPPLAERSRRVQDGYAAERWPELVERVRTGPPAWSPTRLEPVDTVVNLAEMFLHHEDVLRAAPGWEPRLLPDDLEQGLWSVLTRTGRLLFRRSPWAWCWSRPRTAAGWSARLPRVPAPSCCAAPPASCSCTPRDGSASRGSRSRGPRTHAQPSRTPTSASDR